VEVFLAGFIEEETIEKIMRWDPPEDSGR